MHLRYIFLLILSLASQVIANEQYILKFDIMNFHSNGALFQFQLDAGIKKYKLLHQENVTFDHYASTTSLDSQFYEFVAIIDNFYLWMD